MKHIFYFSIISLLLGCHDNTIDNTIHSPNKDVNHTNIKKPSKEDVHHTNVKKPSKEDVHHSILEKVKSYKYTYKKGKLINGSSTEFLKCDGKVRPEDSLSDINIFSKFYQNSCYTDGRYNNSNYYTSVGKLSYKNENYIAYKISKPKKLATEFLGSNHSIRIKFKEIGNYKAYSYNGENFKFISNVKAKKSNKYYEVPGLNLDSIDDKLIFIFVPSKDKQPNVLYPLSKGTHGAEIDRFQNYIINQYTANVGKDKSLKSISDFNQGPNTHANVYGQNQYFDLVRLSDDSLGIIWQDKLNYKTYISKFNPKTKETKTIELTKPSQYSGNYLLAGSNNDDKHELYLFFIEANSKKSPLDSFIVKYNEDGFIIKNKKTSDLFKNMKNFGKLPSAGSNKANLSIINGKLAILYSAIHQNGHQWAELNILDSSDFHNIKSYGNITSHSFSQILKKSKDELSFLSLNLGDVYPRGIKLNRFDDKRNDDNVVFTYKMKLNSSGDNKTYSELGGIVDTGDGYLITFISEHNINGKVLDSLNTKNYLNHARNIGVVKVMPNFQQSATKGMEVSPDMMLLKGDYPDEFGAFDKNRKQSVSGVHWLTKYPANNLSRNASRLKMIKFGNDNLLLWEEWSKDKYLNTKMMLISDDVKSFSSKKTLKRVRLNRRDELININGKIYSVTGVDKENLLNIIEIKNTSSYS